MAALDLWHRERLSDAAKEKLRVFEEIRRVAPGDEAKFDAAFRGFVAELTERQVRILNQLLAELNDDQALH